MIRAALVESGDPRSGVRWLSACLFAAAWVAIAPNTSLAIAVLSAGLAAAVVGIGVHRLGPVTVGTGVFGAGILVASVDGAPTWTVLFGIGAILVAWDLSLLVASFDRQIPSGDVDHASVCRLVIRKLGIGSGLVVFVFVVSFIGSDGQPVIALVLLLSAGALISLSLIPVDVIDLSELVPNEE